MADPSEPSADPADAPGELLSNPVEGLATIGVRELRGQLAGVLRRAAAEYLRRRRAKETREAYRRAYTRRRGIVDEFRGWDDEGVWPER